MKLLAFAGCALLALLAPVVAHADEDPPPPASLSRNPTATVDTVHLRSGGVVLGRVSEIVTGVRVSILTPTGELRNVPWSDVDRVVVANTAPPPQLPPRRPPPAPPPPPPMEPDLPPMDGPRAFVHIEASGTTYLYRAPDGTTDYQTACTAPCDMELPIGDSYKIGGNGTKTTPSFKLKASPGGSVTLKVDGANWFGVIGGGTLAVSGAMTAYVGLLLAAADDSSRRSGSGSAGLACFLIGGAATALGTLAFLRSNTTDVVQTSPKAASDAFVRAPSWRTASATEQGHGATFPVLLERRF
ncbi:MAG TPA: hypothetical protein VLT33_34560 [Labilithrix sp.]|nr:hypothetical protein [Labilithrix sp.]